MGTSLILGLIPIPSHPVSSCPIPFHPVPSRPVPSRSILFHPVPSQVMVQEIVEVFTDMVNCSLFPDAHGSLSKSRKERLGEWVSFDDSLHESSGAWLPLIVRQIRYGVDNVTCNACIRVHVHLHIRY